MNKHCHIIFLLLLICSSVVMAVESASTEDLRCGDEAMKFALYGNAAEFYDRYLLALPQDGAKEERFEILLKKADALLMDGQLDAAEKAIDEAGRVFSNPSYEQSAKLSLFKARAAYGREEYEECLELLQIPVNATGVVSDVESARIRLSIDALIKLGRLEEAVAILDVEVAHLPENSPETFDLRFKLAKLYLALGQTRLADGMARGISSIVPKERKLAFDMFCIELKLQVSPADVAGALGLLREIADRRPTGPNPDWWELYWCVINQLEILGQYDPALSYLPSALTVATDDDKKADCLMVGAICEEKSGRTEQAMEYYDQVRKEYPGSLRWLPATSSLARLKADKQDNMGAFLLYSEILANDDVASEIKYHIGISATECAIAAGKQEQAIEIFEQMSDWGNDEKAKFQALVWGGECAASIGNYNKAAAMYDEAISLAPDLPEAEDVLLSRARMLVKAENYVAAKDAYGKFMVKYPDSANIGQAGLESCLLREHLATTEEEKIAVIEDLLKFSRTIDNEKLAIDGYFAASQYAEKIGNNDWAIAILEELINKYSDSKYAYIGWYKCIKLKFYAGDGDGAIKLSQQFMEKSGNEELVNRIRMVVADYYALHGEYEQALKMYDLVAEQSKSKQLVRSAVYEGAICLYNLQRNGESMVKLEQLRNDSDVLKSNPLLYARALMLSGDIYALRNEFYLAKSSFHQVSELVGIDNEIKFAARGREAEMLLAIGNPDKQDLDEAEKILENLIRESDRVNPQICEMANFRLAQCLEMKDENDRALRIYEDIVVYYTSHRNAGELPFWKYYVESVFAAGRLLVAKGDYDSMSCALQMYQELVNSGLPRSNEAAKRAEEIDEIINSGVLTNSEFN